VSTRKAHRAVAGLVAVTNVRLIDIVVPAGRRALHDVGELATSIREVGLLSPIILTSTMQLVAGQHRLEACRSLGWSAIPARVVTVDALRRELIEIDENVARVELSALERAEALARRRDIYHALHPEVRPVRERGGPGRGAKKSSAIVALVRPFAKDAAARAGISTRTVWRSVQIAELLDPAAADLIRSTPIANSTIDLVRLSRMERAVQREVAKVLANGTPTIKSALRQLRWRKIGQPGSRPVRGRHYRLVTSDFASAAAEIAAGSVALVVADVPWSRKFAPRLTEVVQVARRVLRPGGRALVMVGQQHLPAIFAAVGTSLRYRWTLCLRQPKPKQNWAGSVLSAWLPIVVFEQFGGAQPLDFRWDVLNDMDPTKKTDPWEKSEQVLRELVDRYSQPGDTVLDLFCGSGSAGAAALAVGRKFIGIDVDPAAISTAATRLAATTWADPEFAPRSRARAAYPV
jgi:ParB family chromosome partitioning protein